MYFPFSSLVSLLLKEDQNVTCNVWCKKAHEQFPNIYIFQYRVSQRACNHPLKLVLCTPQGNFDAQPRGENVAPHQFLHQDKYRYKRGCLQCRFSQQTTLYVFSLGSLAYYLVIKPCTEQRKRITVRVCAKGLWSLASVAAHPFCMLAEPHHSCCLFKLENAEWYFDVLLDQRESLMESFCCFRLMLLFKKFCCKANFEQA